MLNKKEQINTVFELIYKLLPQKIYGLCSEWAEEKRYMTESETSRPGPFRFENSPYTKEILDCSSKTSPVREVAVMKAVQLGFTTSIIENSIAYTVDVDPCPSMFVMPSDTISRQYKKLKIDKLIDNTGLRPKIFAQTLDKKTRETGNTSMLIQFVNGFLKFGSANNGASLRNIHIKKLYLDELDAYPATLPGEGDPVLIAVARTDSYAKDRKIFYISSPVASSQSRINQYYLKGDQRKYFVPCPHCGQMQELVFYKEDGGLYSLKKSILKDGVKTRPYGLMFNSSECKEGDFSSVHYKCKNCGGKIEEYQKKEIENKGEWRVTNPIKNKEYRSYHISALYSLTFPWRDLVQKFLDAGNDPAKLQTFYNLYLGLPFEETSGNIDETKVSALQDLKLPNNFVPKEFLFLTCAVDVQQNRLEAEIKAWGDRYRGHGVDHRIFYGNPADLNDSCWQELLKIKEEVFTDGRQIEIMGIDSGDGEKRDVVYEFCSNYGDGIIVPLKGFISTARTNGKFKIAEAKDYDGLSLIEIYTDLYKHTLARYFNQNWNENEPYPEGWQSFANTYTKSYFKQLTSEKKVRTKTKGGLDVIRWVQHGRNEAFDLNVYNLCLCDVFLLQICMEYLGLEQLNNRMAFEFLKENSSWNKFIKE